MSVLAGLLATSLSYLILRTNSLMCYSCFSELSNSTCKDTPRSVSWVECVGKCQVWQLYSEVDSRVYMFERSCSGVCRNGCTQLADMEHRFVGCSSCCDSDFCNVGNSISYSDLLVPVVISVAFLFATIT